MRVVGVLGAVGIVAVIGCAWSQNTNNAGKGEAQLRPATGMVVTVDPGTFHAADGTARTLETARLTFDPPETRPVSVTSLTPRNFNETYTSWDPWPSVKTATASKAPTYISLSPKRDEEGTSMLGMMYREVVPESVVVTSEDGSKKFEAGKDYILDAKWALIANSDGKLGEPGKDTLKVEAKFALQRLDLVQADARGRPSVKKGKSVWVCPELPEPDAGNAAIAGIYIAPWKRDGAYTVAQEDILPIVKTAPVEPRNYDKLARARAKLAKGEEVKIAFLGDSITLGAEAPKWWDDLWTEKNLGYASRLVVGLRKQYPKATLTPIAAFKGGITTGKVAELFEKEVAPKRPDVLIIAFGANDAHGPAGQDRPMNPPEQHKKDVLAIIAKAKAAGTEVILVTPMQPSPFLASNIGERIKLYRKVQLDLADEEGVGCADVFTAWMNQAKHGIPPFSQLHNCNNHPGPRGHAIYADTIMPFFK